MYAIISRESKRIKNLFFVIMIHIIDDFYNKVAIEIRSKYFPKEEHGKTNNKNYWKTLKTIEDFNNGCLDYRKLVDRLSKSCNDTTENVQKTVEKYIIKPKKNDNKNL